jgi:hypothetical protein
MAGPERSESHRHQVKQVNNQTQPFSVPLALPVHLRSKACSLLERSSFDVYQRIKRLA